MIGEGSQTLGLNRRKFNKVLRFSGLFIFLLESREPCQKVDGVRNSLPKTLRGETRVGDDTLRHQDTGPQRVGTLLLL